jgi:hypothetical protein
MGWEDDIPDLEDVQASDVEDLSGGRASKVPDTEKWRAILMSSDFADGIYMLDQAFLDSGYNSEIHVGRNAFGEVEYQGFPRPDVLDLMIADDYDILMDEVSHPFFDGMEIDEVRSPRDYPMEIGFGGYSDTRSLDLGLESTDIRAPTLPAFNDRVIGDTFSRDSSYRIVEE